MTQSAVYQNKNGNKLSKVGDSNTYFSVYHCQMWCCLSEAYNSVTWFCVYMVDYILLFYATGRELKRLAAQS